MSLPRLVLDGDTTKSKITSIGVTYNNDTLFTKPAYITRSSYDVKREFSLKNVSNCTAERYPNLVYDQVRLVHNWIGYIDVLTESVAITASSSAADAKTVALIKDAVVLEITNGIEHTIASFSLDPTELGPDKASLDGFYTKAFEQGLDWVYKITKNGAKDYTENTSIYWLIKNIKIDDMGNNTSRVTFNFIINEPWQSLSGIIDGLTP